MRMLLTICIVCVCGCSDDEVMLYVPAKAMRADPTFQWGATILEMHAAKVGVGL